MKIVTMAIAALSLTGCAVYNTPYPYPAPVYVQPAYVDPWPVRVVVPQPMPQVIVPQVIEQQPSVIYEDNRQYYYGQRPRPNKPQPQPK